MNSDLFRESLSSDGKSAIGAAVDLPLLRLLEQAVSTTHNGVIIADARAPDLPIIFANAAVSRISGYAPEEFLGRNCRFLQRGERDQPGLTEIRAALRERRSCDTVVRNYRKDGTPFWNEVRISPVTDEHGVVTHFIGFQVDISARKEAESALARRDAILEAVSAATERLMRGTDYTQTLPEALWAIGDVTGADHLCVWQQRTSAMGRTLNLVQAWSRSGMPAYKGADFQEIIWESPGWPSAEILRQGKWLQGGRADCTAPEQALLEKLGVDSFLCLPIFDGPNRFWGALTQGCRSADVRWAPVEVDALFSATRVLGAVVQNQTTGTALRLSEQRFRVLSEVSPAGIFECNEQGRVTYTNRRLREMFGIGAEDFLTGTWRGRFAQRDLAAFASAWSRAISHGGRFEADFRIREKNGDLRWLRAAATPMRDAETRIIGHVGTVDDVTEYHRAAEAARQSEAQYRSLVTSLREVVFQTDAAGRWTYLNPAWTEITGFAVAESLGQPFLQYVHPDDRERNAAAFAPLIQRQKKDCRHAVRYLTGTGGFRWIEVFARLVEDDAGGIAGTAGTLSDITDRKEAEDMRRRQQAALEAAIDGVGMIDELGHFTYLNAVHLQMFGYTDPSELIGRSWRELYDPADTAVLEPSIREALTSHGRWRGIRKGRRRDGSMFDQEMSLTRIQGGGAVCVCRDVTETRLAHERLQQSLREKEVMLREIHHRVKNNMQIVSSLLNLQLSTLQDEKTRLLFIEAQNRIASMALVHEKLYQSADLGRIDFSDYVRDLTDSLIGAHGDRNRSIRFELRSENFFLGVDTAVPCGLIINELVSNAYKHAFPDGRSGRICLTLRKTADALQVEIADDGCGIPDSVDLAHTRSLGMQLVHTLTGQLQGTIRVERRHGTRFILVLREVAHKRLVA